MLLERFEIILHKLSCFFGRISEVALLVLVLLITTDVFLRALFNFPIDGALEISEYLMIFIVFMGTANCQLKGRNVRVDFIVDRLPYQSRLASQVVMDLISTGLFLLISYENIMQFFQKEGNSAVLSIPMSPFFLVIAVGMVFVTVFLLKSLYHSSKQLMDSKLRLNTFIFLVTIIIVILAMVFILTQPAIWGGTPVSVGVVGIALILFLLLLGMPVGFTLMLVGFLGIIALRDIGVAFDALGTIPYRVTANFTFTVVATFVLMGFFCFYSKLAQLLYRAAYVWVGHFRGGLAITTTIACAIFGAVSGESLSTSVTMSTVALPEMRKYNYNAAFACASIASAGTLAVMIPPSIVMLLYALLTNVSVGNLFIAGIGPGILLALLFSVMIYIRCTLNPDFGPKGEKTDFSTKLVSLKGIWPILILFCLVIIGLYSGIFTPTEGGALGAFGALIIGVVKRQLGRKDFLASLSESSLIISMVFIIIIGGEIFGRFIVLSDIPVYLADMVKDASAYLSPYIILLIILFIYMLLGCLLPAIPMIILTVPIFHPVIVTLGFDPIWYGVVMVLVFEMAVISPPVGINVYAISGVASDVPMGSIFKAVVPFILMLWLCIFLLILFPGIATYLPSVL